jgi:hypothetical protein
MPRRDCRGWRTCRRWSVFRRNQWPPDCIGTRGQRRQRWWWHHIGRQAPTAGLRWYSHHRPAFQGWNWPAAAAAVVSRLELASSDAGCWLAPARGASCCLLAAPAWPLLLAPGPCWHGSQHHPAMAGTTTTGRLRVQPTVQDSRILVAEPCRCTAFSPGCRPATAAESSPNSGNFFSTANTGARRAGPQYRATTHPMRRSVRSQLIFTH